MVEAAAAAAELESFRRRWRSELARGSQGKQRAGGGRKRPREAEGEELPEPLLGWGRCGGIPWRRQQQPEGAAEGSQAVPLLGPPRSPEVEPGLASETPRRATEDLLGQLIRDLNEINEVPFFDVQLPYELALKVFQYLGRTELGRCAQVSRAWKILAEDEVLWFRLCQQEGYLRDNQISDFTCWKKTLQKCREKEQALRTNWKNRIGAVSQLQYELGKVLCDVHSCDGVVIAGYTSGDVKLWDTRTWDYTAPVLEQDHGSLEPGTRPPASFVRINNSLAVAAYEDGTIQVWSLMIGREPIHRYRHNQKVQALALSPDGAAVATASAFHVKVESATDQGYWKTVAEFEIQKLVDALCLVPQVTGRPVAVAAADEEVYLLKTGASTSVLHSIYGQPVTCLDVSVSEAACGVKGFIPLINETNKIFLYNLETGKCSIQLGSSLGDFTCINLRDSPPWMLVAGNKDRRVRVFDLRRNEPVLSLYGHQLGVSAVQMDDWKIVSGEEGGLVCVWDQRMGNKLWEMHARHPVRYVRFNAHSLITANIPNDKTPQGANMTDDDLTAHRRHRGVIYAYEFSVDQLAQESVLPICRSSYNEVTGYNYGISLAVPYDSI